MVHRDDLPNEMLEFLEKQFPDTKIICMGDLPEGSPLLSLVDEIETKIELARNASIKNGTCFYCHKAIEIYDPANKKWKPPEGWSVISDAETRDVHGWECPDCNKEDML